MLCAADLIFVPLKNNRGMIFKRRILNPPLCVLFGVIFACLGKLRFIFRTKIAFIGVTCIGILFISFSSGVKIRTLSSTSKGGDQSLTADGSFCSSSERGP